MSLAEYLTNVQVRDIEMGCGYLAVGRIPAPPRPGPPTPAPEPPASIE
jgi:hypothetical protein